MQGPSISAASYPTLIEGRQEIVSTAAFINLDDSAGVTLPFTSAVTPAVNTPAVLAAAPAPAAAAETALPASAGTGTMSAAVVTEAGPAQGAAATGVLDSAVSGEPVALMAARQDVMAGAAAGAVSAAGQIGSRRLLNKGHRRTLLQTCPPANPCLVSLRGKLNICNGKLSG